MKRLKQGLESHFEDRGMQVHMPVAWSQFPLPEHVISSWAVSVAEASLDHAKLRLHSLSEQSAPSHPKKHLHLRSAVSHSPWPEQRFGHAAKALSASRRTAMIDEAASRTFIVIVFSLSLSLSLFFSPSTQSPLSYSLHRLDQNVISPLRR